MIPRKLLEAAFTRVWLLILPLVVTPLVVIGMTTTTPEYQSSAAVWVSQPSNIAATTFSGGSNPYQSPADAQVQAMRDLLSTKSFRSAVAVAAGMDPKATDAIARSAYVITTGPNLINIVARRPDPDSAQAIVAAIISQYQARTTTESQRETSITVDYYNTQIGIAQTELDSRKAAAAAYAAENPKVLTTVTGTGTSTDATYARLLDAVASQTKLVDGLVADLQDAQRTAATAPQSLAATFNVQDLPSLPSAPLPVGITKKVGYPFAALLFGALISATYLYVRFRTDHAIRSTEDLVDLPVPVLGAIPMLPTPKREAMRPWTWLKRARRDYARTVAASISVVPARGELS